MEYPGLLNWANSVRQTMANDPGRQLFKDQVQIHGFSFLDDYLDNIISGQRQDPLIELVKTPGRKKAAWKRPYTPQTDMVVPIELPTTPVETFPQTDELLPIGFPTTLVDAFAQTDELLPIEVPTTPIETLSQTEVLPIEVPTAPSSQLLYERGRILTDIQEEDPELSVKLIDKPIPPPSFPTLLEPIPLRKSPKIIHSPLIGLVKTPGQDGAALKSPHPSQSDVVLPIEVFTTPADTFAQTDELLPIEVPTIPFKTFPQTDVVLPIEVSTTPVESPPQTDELLPIEVLTTPVDTFEQTDELLPIEVPTTPVETFSQTDEVLPIEVPTAPSSQLLYERDRILTDIQEEDAEMSIMKLMDKPVPPPSFPTLPEPIPLRKSTKPPRDPSINTVLLGAATPGAPIGGMRTSWLMKAREANVDKLGKKSHSPGTGSEVGASSSLTIQGTKRKSDVFFLTQVGTSIQDDERPPKLAKTSKWEDESETQSQPPAIVESGSEGVFDRLKKVVEDLGIRVDRKVEERKQPEVMKVLQMAAVAAKKQQEEADKKAARLKEMESRRQLAIQRKAEEEKAKVLEEERKMKEEAERRKKEREPIKYAVKKKEDDTWKKRKIEMEKKQEIKKPSSSVLFGKSHLKPVLKSSSSTNLSHIYGSSSQPDPFTVVQSQTAARVKVQIHVPKPKPVKHAVPSEDIELPEINSEYSDSEDEDRVRTFNPPEWAQSPELRQALEMQSTMNPDDIFGAVRPLKMEEIFKSRTSRFRARTSSANWTGTDRLTMQEQGEYARRMGFK